ncbi:MAG TPA: hypothetical protein VEC12_09305 [Bacteroidia bacterium]|nr:hypothetical protein [Bacteroidia bacterium]
MVDNWVTGPTTVTQHSVFVFLNDKLYPGQSITIDDGNGNLYPLGSWNPLLSTADDYAAQATMFANSIPGVSAFSSGPTVTITVDVNTSPFTCGETITVNIAGNTTTSFVDCPPSMVNYPYEVCAPGSYRFGFNGQEKDNEVSEAGNSYTAEYWQYDSRLGRRFNVDPIIKIYESPYACYANNPIGLINKNDADTSSATGEA